MVFWNYCPGCGKRLLPNEEFCLNCGCKTVFDRSDDEYFFTPPIHDIGFFNFKIDFSPYINSLCDDFDFDICSCGYLNKADNEFCYHCGVKRIETGFSRFIRRHKKPKFSMDTCTVNSSPDIECICGAVNDGDSEFCEMCGRKLNKDSTFDNYGNFNFEFDNPVFCFCGEENNSDSQFCRNCGLPLDSYGDMPTIMKLCVCSVLNEATSKYCIECGNDLEMEMSVIVCVCGTANDVNSRFCSSCERPLNSERLLKTRLVCDCGKIMDFNVEFCPNCGKNIRKTINRKKTFKSIKKLLR